MFGFIFRRQPKQLYLTLAFVRVFGFQAWRLEFCVDDSALPLLSLCDAFRRFLSLFPELPFSGPLY